MPAYDNPGPYDSNLVYDMGEYFFPATDAIVPPIYIVEDPYYPCDPAMNRLMRHYKNQQRGRNIFKMSDGTFVDSQVGGTPPNMIQPPTDPYARAISESGGATVEQDFFQVPYVVRTYYGGTYNQITAAEKAALIAAGYLVDVG